MSESGNNKKIALYQDRIVLEIPFVQKNFESNETVHR